jgi:hypothetical protein
LASRRDAFLAVTWKSHTDRKGKRVRGAERVLGGRANVWVARSQSSALERRRGHPALSRAVISWAMTHLMAQRRHPRV